MEGRGTPDQSQAGPGDPPRDTTLRTSVHTQLADGEQGTPYNTYSPYRAWVDLEAGAAAARPAGSARSATGAAMSAAFSQGRLSGSHERLGTASAAPTNTATPPEVMPANQARPRMEGGAPLELPAWRARQVFSSSSHLWQQLQLSRRKRTYVHLQVDKRRARSRAARRCLRARARGHGVELLLRVPRLWGGWPALQTLETLQHLEWVAPLDCRAAPHCSRRLL